MAKDGATRQREFRASKKKKDERNARRRENYHRNKLLDQQLLEGDRAVHDNGSDHGGLETSTTMPYSHHAPPIIHPPLHFIRSDLTVNDIAALSDVDIVNYGAYLRSQWDVHGDSIRLRQAFQLFNRGMLHRFRMKSLGVVAAVSLGPSSAAVGATSATAIDLDSSDDDESSPSPPPLHPSNVANTTTRIEDGDAKPPARTSVHHDDDVENFHVWGNHDCDQNVAD